MAGPKYPLVVDTSNGIIRELAADEYLLDQTDNGTRTADTSPLTIGHAVYQTATANIVNGAQADALATAEAVGLALESVLAGAAVRVHTNGDMVLTTAQWDAITGGTTGLAPGSAYFLDAAIYGNLSTTPPSASGQFIQYLGTAVSTTKMHVAPVRPIGLT